MQKNYSRHETALFNKNMEIRKQRKTVSIANSIHQQFFVCDSGMTALKNAASVERTKI